MFVEVTDEKLVGGFFATLHHPPSWIGLTDSLLIMIFNKWNKSYREQVS